MKNEKFKAYEILQLSHIEELKQKFKRSGGGWSDEYFPYFNAHYNWLYAKYIFDKRTEMGATYTSGPLLENPVIVPYSVWGAKMMQNVDSIEKQVAYAKSLVGKYVSRGTTIGKVTEFGIFTGDKHNGGCDRWDKTFDKYGVIVYINIVKLDNDTSWNAVISEYQFHYDIVSPPIVINGCVAEKTKDGYKFGCAEISRSQLSLAREFLKTSSYLVLPDSTNRNIESVKIGVGNFNLTDLNALLDN